jgi:hypothetical protein
MLHPCRIKHVYHYEGLDVQIDSICGLVKMSQVFNAQVDIELMRKVEAGMKEDAHS